MPIRSLFKKCRVTVGSMGLCLGRSKRDEVTDVAWSEAIDTFIGHEANLEVNSGLYRQEVEILPHLGDSSALPSSVDKSHSVILDLLQPGDLSLSYTKQ